MDKPKVVDKAPVGVDLKAGTYFWCSCGQSENQPFCDGSHKGSSFSPTKFVLEEDKKVWLCQCKYTKGQPFCDGTHKGVE